MLSSIICELTIFCKLFDWFKLLYQSSRLFQVAQGMQDFIQARITLLTVEEFDEPVGTEIPTFTAAKNGAIKNKNINGSYKSINIIINQSINQNP